MTRRLPMALAAWAALALAVWAALAASAAAAEDLKPALQAEVRFLAPDGTALAEVAPGEPFEVELGFRALVGAVPGDLRPMGWIRRTGPGDLSCGETAAAYRAAGSGAVGGVELTGVVVGVLAEDGSLAIADPRRSVGSANLVAARRFEGRPTAMVADPTAGVFLVSDPATGTVRAVDTLGGERVVAEGLDRPGPLVAAASGGAWLLEGSGDLVRIGTSAPFRMALGARALPPVDTAATGGRVLALAGEEAGTELVLVEDGGVERVRIAAPGALDAGLTGDAALWLGPEGLTVTWLDAPEAPQRIALDGGRFDALAVSPEGRFAIIFSRTLAGFGVIDLALGRMVQAAGTEAPVAEVGFLPGIAALRLADQSAVGVMDLRLARSGEEVAIGIVNLGPPSPPAGPDAALLAPFLPEPMMLAVNGPSYTGFLVDRRNAISTMPPMEAIRLRGGVPRIVRALDRGFRADPGGPGRFRTAARLPQAGGWELVVSAGVGQSAFCATVPTPPLPLTEAAELGRVLAETAGPGRVRLRLTGAGAAPAAGLRGDLIFASLAGNWRGRTPFVTDAGGLTVESYDLAAATPLVIQVRAGAGPDFAPFVLEALP